MRKSHNWDSSLGIFIATRCQKAPTFIKFGSKTGSRLAEKFHFGGWLSGAIWAVLARPCSAGVNLACAGAAGSAQIGESRLGPPWLGSAKLGWAHHPPIISSHPAHILKTDRKHTPPSKCTICWYLRNKTTFYDEIYGGAKIEIYGGAKIKLESVAWFSAPVWGQFLCRVGPSWFRSAWRQARLGSAWLCWILLGSVRISSAQRGSAGLFLPGD